MNDRTLAFLRQQQELGFTTLYRTVLPADLPDATADERLDKRDNPVPALDTSHTAEPPSPVLSAEEKAKALAQLEEENRTCLRCELGKTRKHFVFGSGNPCARLLFIGEAPGADEDEQGLPFVGRAGQLLTKMIENGMGLKRTDVYIANILKCRPPGNRDPLPDEREHCTSILLMQLRIIRPEFICCLGRISARFLLNLPDTVSLREMRGRFYDSLGAKVCATYHPSALLQHPEWKSRAWEDLQFLMHAMGLAIPRRTN